MTRPAPDLEAIARSLATVDDLPGALALANANGLSLHDTFVVQALVLSNRILRSPAGDIPIGQARTYLAGLIHPKTGERDA
jgi:hypothetical protein